MTDGSRDALTPFVIERAGIRGALVRLDATTGAILGAHEYPPPLAHALGELVAAAALLASTLKLKGSLVVQLSGDGPVRLLVVECTDALELRATAQWSDGQVRKLPPDADLRVLAGVGSQARLVLTLDPRDAGTMYQGIVALEGDSVADTLQHYLSTSEQLQSRIVLACNDYRAQGLLLQRLPSSGPEDDPLWERLAGSLDDSAKQLETGGDVHALLHRLFPADDVRAFESRPARFHCRCSQARAANALRIAGANEIEAAIEERGDVEVTCEFCNHRYTFTPSQARALFAPLPRTSH